jgi:hypothetical protein
MSYQKTQGYSALNIVPSDNANVPYVKVVAQGISDSINTNKLISSGAAFVKERVQVGDIVYNMTTGVAATIILVKDEDELELNADIFVNVGGTEEYVIYAASAVTNYQNANNGCVLYIGETGDLRVTPIGSNDPVLFKNVPVGFFPVQVKKVWTSKTTAKELVALW